MRLLGSAHLSEELTKEINVVDLFEEFWRQKLFIVACVFIAVSGAIVFHKTIDKEFISRIELNFSSDILTGNDSNWEILQNHIHREDVYNEWLQEVGASSLDYSKHLQNYKIIKGIRFEREAAITVSKPYVILRLPVKNPNMEDADIYEVLRSLIDFLGHIDKKMLSGQQEIISKIFEAFVDKSSELSGRELAIVASSAINNKEVFKISFPEKPRKTLNLLPFVFFGSTSGLFLGLFITLLRFDPRN